MEHGVVGQNGPVVISNVKEDHRRAYEGVQTQHHVTGVLCVEAVEKKPNTHLVCVQSKENGENGVISPPVLSIVAQVNTFFYILTKSWEFLSIISLLFTSSVNCLSNVLIH